ncbi:MAG TPA: branched-chain amino acid ABC transporter substrate-binding protein [Holophaga sp.]|nr:branched-chain amino acid ABC transporter substrate-binding protein [Holophaga sp.]HPS67514.1 branched-chain amino acid ABC transporter substrate-binding protein [Holophaga sp.]
MNKTVSFVAPVVATLCLLIAGCSKEAKVIKIATQSPLSGALSVIGSDIKSGSQLAIEQLAEPLTKLGFKVELAPFDDQANPDTGVANAKAIVSDPAVLGVVGHYNSGVMIPSSEEYHAAQLCNVSPANTNPKVTERGYPEINRICGRDDVQGAVGAQFAKSKGIKVAYVLHDKTAYGQGIAEYFKKESETQGIKVAGFTGTEEKANFDAILSPILSSKPDCIYFGGMFDQAAVLFKQARQKGFKGLCLSDDGFDSPDATKIGGDALLEGAGTYFSTVSGPAAAYPDTAKFVTDFKAKFGNNPQPFAAQSFDCTAILLKAIENAANANGGKLPTRDAVCKAVRELQDFHGVTGTMTFNPKGDLLKAKYFIIQVSSADPGKWASNRIDQTLDVAPPQ